MGVAARPAAAGGRAGAPDRRGQRGPRADRRLSGPGSQAERRAALAELFGRATAAEQTFLRALVGGELRQGALAGVMADAVAAATGIPRAAVDRATMLRGDARAVAEVALREGAAGLAAFRLEVGRPLGPMLASPAASLEAAMARVGEGAVDWKLDGARIQVHRDGDEVAIFSRSLDDLTARLPEVAAAALALPARRVVLDGEAIALRADGRPEPFQVTASRVAAGAPGIAPVLFDVLHLDGEDLLDAPLSRAGGGAGGRGARGAAGAARGHRRPGARRRPTSTPRWPPATRAWWSRRSTPPTPPAAGGPRG